MDYFLQLTASGIMSGSIYALIALGIVLIYKTSGVFNLAVGPIVALGTFLSWWLIAEIGLPWPLSFICLIGVAAVLGILIERYTMRPMIGQPMLSAVMITIAISVVIAGVITITWPGLIRKYPEIIPSGTAAIGSIVLSQESLIGLFIGAVVFIAFLLFFNKTMLGLAMRGTAEDQQLAQSGGIRVTSIIAIAWGVAIATAFISGILLGNMHGVNQGAISSLGYKAFPAVIVGGLESITGAIIGGLLIGVLESLGAGYLDKYVAGGVAEVMPFIVLMIILMIKPYGLFGYTRIERV